MTRRARFVTFVSSCSFLLLLACAKTATSPIAASPGSVRETLGPVAKVVLSERVPGSADPKTRELRDAKDVEALLAAIGLDQQPGDGQRRCPDALTLTFLSSSGEPRAVLGLCNELQGAELFAGGKRGSIAIADPPAFKKVLDRFGG